MDWNSNTFSNNTIDATNNVLDTGIAHDAAYDYVRLDSQYNSVTNNTIINTTEYKRCVGIYGSHNTVSGNTLTNNPAGYSTVGLESGAHHNVVTGNTLKGGDINNLGSNNSVTPNP